MSIEALCERFLEALHMSDNETLSLIAVNKEEYRRCVWPQVPAYSIESWRNNFDFVWSRYEMKSWHGLSSTLERYSGKKYLLIRVRFAEEMSDYTTYKVYRDARVTVSGEDGTERELKLFGSIIEMDGRYKIMSYNIR